MSVTIPTIKNFHAHIYFTADDEKEIAFQMHEAFIEYGKNNLINVGNIHEKPMGPHTAPMFRLAFGQEQFMPVVNYLMLNRKGLSVLVHPETGNDLDDHTNNHLWLGQPLYIYLSGL